MGEESDKAATDDGPVRVFMSYRRADDRHFIGRLHDRLCDAFGDEMVFRDIDSIPAGTNFRQVILRTLNEVDAVVAVIGPNWARTSGGDEASDTDYVFLELAEALRQGKPMVPVLMEGTVMPSADELPLDLRALSDINAISVHGDPAFRRDSARLIEAIGAVVAEDRARVAREQHEAEEEARRAEAERSERRQLAEQLRAEERAARARLAELEEAATRRQIDLERARLDAIAEQLRQAESVEGVAPSRTAEPREIAEVEATEVVPATAPRVEQSAEAAPVEARAVAPTSSHVEAGSPWLEILIIAALVLGVVGMFMNRSVDIGGTVYQFNELKGDSTLDVTIWILTLAIGVPLLLGHRMVEQRLVLIGVTISSFLFEFLQASATVRYGIDGYDEGAWDVVRILETICLVGACWTVRRHTAESSPSSPRHRITLVVVAIGCAALLIAATNDQWSQAPLLVDAGLVPGRSPFVVWLLLIALGPIAVTVALAARGSYAAQVTLATIATLATLNYYAEAHFFESVFGRDGSRWELTAFAHLLLAGVAWWAVTARARSAPPSP